MLNPAGQRDMPLRWTLVPGLAAALLAFFGGYWLAAADLHRCMQSGLVPQMIDKSKGIWLLDGNWSCNLAVSVAQEQCKSKGGRPLLYRDFKLVCSYPQAELEP